jgi:hypothetical protein
LIFEPRNDRETRRLVVFSQDRRQVLLIREKLGYVLPSVEVPLKRRLAENLNTATKDKYGCAAISLFEPTHHSANRFDGVRYHAMECVCDGGIHGADLSWMQVSSLQRAFFLVEMDYDALKGCVEEASTNEVTGETPFARRSWFRELTDWVTESIKPLGLQLNGTICQFTASPSFSLIRFETKGPAFWFKAVGDPNRHEFPVTLRLAGLFPECLPRIVATHPAWNGWLTLEAGGTNLADTKDVSMWNIAARNLARLQIGSIDSIGPLVQSGVQDARAATLARFITPFLDVIAELMEEQTKVPPPVLHRQELNLLGSRIEDALALQSELGVPDALGHFDLNPGNMIVSGDRCVFLDWAEAYIGHPFSSLEYLLEHFRRRIGADCAETGLVDSYSEPWNKQFNPKTIGRALALSPLVGVFTFAASLWRKPIRIEDEKTAAYLRSLARRMHREAQRCLLHGSSRVTEGSVPECCGSH